MKQMFTERFLNNFWAKVQKGDGCWEWSGAADMDGYGYVNLNGRTVKSHRTSWVIHNGEIVGELQVLHNCDNPSCVNPEHLWLGTNLQNQQDKMRKGRHSCGDVSKKQGENHPRSKLKWNQISEIRRLYDSGNFNYKSLAAMFHVSFQNVGAIVTGRSWKSMEGAE